MTQADETVARPLDLFIRFLQRAKPLRRIPIPVRYGATVLIVLLCLWARYALDGFYPYPYLLFLPAVILSAFVFDRGSGFLATFLSAILAVYFFVEPRGSFELEDVGGALSAAIFTGVGLLASSIIEALRRAVEDLSVANESLAGSRRELAENLALLEALMEGTPDPIFVKDREGRYVRLNSVVARSFGTTTAAIIGRRDRDFLPAAQADAIEAVDREVMQARAPRVVEERVDVAGVGPRWFLSTKAPWMDASGRVLGVIGLSQDIDERRRGEQELRAADAQKGLLLYDINHRVKNHIQSVVSALSMSRRRLTDPTSIEIVDLAIGRLGVLARVYDRLRAPESGAPFVDARDFLGGLVEEVEGALFGSRPIELRTDIDAGLALDLRRAVPIGLIVNEALTNVAKYAYPENRPGTVRVSLGREGERLRLQVRDDGIGRDPERRDGTGVRLIQGLARQLAGEARWSGGPGLALTVEFPIADPD